MEPNDASGGRRTVGRGRVLGLEPLPSRDVIGLTAIFASLCVVSCGAVLFFGSGALRLRGDTGWVGLGLWVGGAASFLLIVRLLEPHKAARHAAHRVRHHARKLRPSRAVREPEPESHMMDAEFDALEDAVDRAGHNRMI
jgi:hypothetical protein